MTAERWEAVKRLFQEALEREPAERAAFVAEAAKDDPALADEVRALLSAHRHADEVFDAHTLTGGVKTLPAVCAYVYAAADRVPGARKLLDDLTARSRSAYVDSAYMAVAYTAVGDKDEALARLEKAYEERSENLAAIRVVPWFASLRSEPRFQALVRRMNFPS